MNTRNLLVAALAAVALPVVGLTGTMLSTAAQADDNLWEHHREHCDALEHEEHDVRDKMVHTADPGEREHLDHRLHEIAEDRDLHCHR